jgi:hypothetical protein
MSQEGEEGDEGMEVDGEGKVKEKGEARYS